MRSKRKKQEEVGEDQAVESVGDLFAGIQISRDTAEESSDDDVVGLKCDLMYSN